jgi:WD40 repeat protein
VWDGGLSIFSGYEDYLQCPNLTMVACNTPSGVNDAVWLPGEQGVLAACDSGCVEMYRVHGPVLCETESRVQAHDDMVLGVALLAGGEKAVTVGQDRKVVVCSIVQEAVLNTYRGHSDAVVAVASHPTSESNFITTSRDGHVRLWDTRKPRPASCMRGLSSSCLAWSSHNENMIAAGSHSGGVVVLDWRGGSGANSCWSKYHPHTREITTLAFAPWNYNVLASGSEDTTVKIYSLKQQSTLYSSSQHTDYVHGVSWHPHQPHVISCGWDGQVLQHTPTTEDSTAGGTATAPMQTDDDSEESICEDHQQMK